MSFHARLARGGLREKEAGDLKVGRFEELSHINIYSFILVRIAYIWNFPDFLF